MGFFSNLFDSNKKEIKRYNAMAEKIMALEPQYSIMSDDELIACTEKFRNRFNNGESLDKLLFEAFAVVREASYRVLNMKHFKVQLIGGIVLHEGRISEMKTGEGKTLVATLPVYLNALTGKGVHLVTVNEYLAKRDSEWMGKVYKFLNLTVGVVLNDMETEEKQEEYKKDIVYSTSSNLGFDYLRDNLTVSKENVMQRELFFAIVDEVDSILIDEARTPLIISGASDIPIKHYKDANTFVRTLKFDPSKVVKEDNSFTSKFNKKDELENDNDYELDEKEKSIALTENGIKKAEAFYKLENLGDIDNMEIYDHIMLALKANYIMKKDVDYIVDKGQIFIVDTNTGRTMFGRRFSKGLHQAIEEKEKVKINAENKTVATITIQNYFRLYTKLSGMTGTAKTEEDEFNKIYALDVVVIPTNLPMQRVDQSDRIFAKSNDKYQAIINDVKDCVKKGQPVLIGTASVEQSEKISKLLNGERILHELLNAKNHEREAQIIAEAGRLKAVTVATNMAGRGTDIILGGNPELMTKQALVKKYRYSDRQIMEATTYEQNSDPFVLTIREQYNEIYPVYKKQCDAEKAEVIKLGGLKIIGTERNESRRVDNQLRGRAGRQGDIGESVFYISFEDDLIKLFGGERLHRLASMTNNLTSRTITKLIEFAQKRVESRNFESRKYVLNYDNVINEQRKNIYKERTRILNGEDIHNGIIEMIKFVLKNSANDYLGDIVNSNNYNEKVELLEEFNEVLFEKFNIFNATPLDIKNEIEKQLEENQSNIQCENNNLNSEINDTNQNKYNGNSEFDNDNNDSENDYIQDDDSEERDDHNDNEYDDINSEYDDDDNDVDDDVDDDDDNDNNYNDDDASIENDKEKPKIKKKNRLFIQKDNEGKNRIYKVMPILSENEVINEKPAKIYENLVEKALAVYEKNIKNFENTVKNIMEESKAFEGLDIKFSDVERTIFLKSLDKHWIEHLDEEEELKEGIGLRSLAQQDPIIAYTRESFSMFEQTIKNMKEEIVKRLLKSDAMYLFNYYINHMQEFRGKNNERVKILQSENAKKRKPQQIVNDDKFKDVQRNDLCPCKSGKKFKNCCGKK